MPAPGHDIALLDGLRVLELASGIAGPAVGQVLADYGAEVVKIESATGDHARALPGFLAWNRGKQSLTAVPGDQRIPALLAGADVCIVGDFSRAPFGIDLAAARSVNPGLIVVETPPYEGDAPWPGGREPEILLSAATGVALRQSSTDGGPVEYVTPIILHAQGYWAATAASSVSIGGTRRAAAEAPTPVVTCSPTSSLRSAGARYTRQRRNPCPLPRPGGFRRDSANAGWQGSTSLTLDDGCGESFF
jgi:crotonobetainyl-CoA:carnitine CoA-transferase CaiB-like acyl-CoA transferase